MRKPSEVSSSIIRKRPSRSITAATVTLGRHRWSMAHYLVLQQNEGLAGPAPSMHRPAAASFPVLALLAAGSAAAQSALPVIQAPPAPANPYGFAALWAQGDIVSRATIVLLVLMSLASWYVLFSKLLAQSRMGGHGRAANASFWKADTVQQGAKALQPGSPYRFIAESAIAATRKHDGLLGKVDLNTWVAQSIERAVGTVHSRTQEGLAVLATVGSTAPFVGLFGTVWGIYNALVRIGASGQASIDKVAGPVGEALIMTAIGLAVAVPAVLGYNWLVRRNKVAMDTVRAFGSDLHTVLLATGSQGA
ncbi:MotA/TolQ/ExbB proton channel family protein [Ramlibacter ginsenosidimutans]|uniref:Biopolymer transport protein ExbB n=2 Tax=Ramlibacter ginsenosidimutans TaxID=502333 RepID=A0A934TQJ1_9BURK|nr:MotA/TolQ/ExbB proton channel family protein [Ramlibacter ginsenosidimutans]